MSTKLFGTDGVRGVANVPPMDSETVMRLGRALASIVRRGSGRHRILVGKDTRLSGYMLETALETGIASMGVDVLLVGPLPTPAVAFVTRSMRADAGIMISASHNPYEDNGIKIFDHEGFKLADSTEDEIERLLQPGHLDELRAKPELIGKAFRIDDAIGRYIVFLKSCVERECSLEGIKLVVDTAHGAAYKVAPQVFFEMGAEVIMTGDRPNGKNINDNCGSLYPTHIAALVREHGADCGIAFDGDADRVIFCDETGDVIDGDTIIAMTALDLKARNLLKGNAVVGTVMSNLGLENVLKDNGIGFYRSDVGDRYVLQELVGRGLSLGGEQSGHIIFLEHNTTGDGLLTALKVLSVLRRTNKPLSTFKRLVPRYPQILENVRVREKIPFSNVPEIVQAVEQAERELINRGRLLLRYSGTELKARVMVECDDEVLCQKVVNALVGSIRIHLGA